MSNKSNDLVSYQGLYKSMVVDSIDTDVISSNPNVKALATVMAKMSPEDLEHIVTVSINNDKKMLRSSLSPKDKSELIKLSKSEVIKAKAFLVKVSIIFFLVLFISGLVVMKTDVITAMCKYEYTDTLEKNPDNDGYLNHLLRKAAKSYLDVSDKD